MIPFVLELNPILKSDSIKRRRRIYLAPSVIQIHRPRAFCISPFCLDSVTSPQQPSSSIYTCERSLRKCTVQTVKLVHWSHSKSRFERSEIQFMRSQAWTPTKLTPSTRSKPEHSKNNGIEKDQTIDGQLNTSEVQPRQRGFLFFHCHHNECEIRTRESSKVRNELCPQRLTCPNDVL